MQEITKTKSLRFSSQIWDRFTYFPEGNGAGNLHVQTLKMGADQNNVAACTCLQPVEARNIKNDSRLSAQWRGCLSGEVFHKVA